MGFTNFCRIGSLKKISKSVLPHSFQNKDASAGKFSIKIKSNFELST